jgi:[ribosomal protein S5]-alanine N-acetyltransferase
MKKGVDLNAVTIRPLGYEDVPELAKMANNKKIWVNVRDRMPYPYNEKDAEHFIKFTNATQPVTVFGICYQQQLIGAIGLHANEDVYRYNYELGYWIGEDHWNKGYATKAIQLMCEFGFKELKANRIVASVFDYNNASKHILQKLGFKCEGIFVKNVFKSGKFIDEHYYAMQKNDFIEL